MLAATCEDVATLKYPLLASPKLDGVRAIVTPDGALLSRSLKPIPNPFVNGLFGKQALAGLDGELILGSPTATDVYRQTVGAVSRHEGGPMVNFHVFDRWDSAGTFSSRIKEATKAAGRVARVIAVEHTVVSTAAELMRYEDAVLEQGYEGVILRAPDGKYKFGRSTLREQGMLKLKRFTDSEFLLIGVEEELSNANEAKRNALGRTERSTAKAGMVPTGRAGALHGKDLKSGVEFHLGTGLCDDDREWFWKHKDRLIGKFVGKYKSFLIGAKDLPRFPVYLGPREGWDLS
jgi:DNA ligase-1